MDAHGVRGDIDTEHFSEVEHDASRGAEVFCGFSYEDIGGDADVEDARDSELPGGSVTGGEGDASGDGALGDDGGV